jgi:Peptidase family M28
VFVAFDQEEAGLLGSRHFAAHPPRDLGKLKCFMTADMLGRSMANVMDEYVFALGGESAARLRALLDEVPHDRGIKVGRLGADLIGTRSDYGPFRDRRVPFLFFSTGQHPDYHRPSDTPDKIDYVRLQRISQWIADLTRRLADDAEAPAWRDGGDPDPDELRTVLELLARVLDHPELFPLTERQRGQVGQVRRQLTAVADSGTYTPLQRVWLMCAARVLLATVF